MYISYQFLNSAYLFCPTESTDESSITKQKLLKNSLLDCALSAPSFSFCKVSRMKHVNPCCPDGSGGGLNIPELFCCIGTPGEVKDSVY